MPFVLFKRKDNKNFDNDETLKICSSVHGIQVLYEILFQKIKPSLKRFDLGETDTIITRT